MAIVIEIEIGKEIGKGRAYGSALALAILVECSG